MCCTFIWFYRQFSVAKFLENFWSKYTDTLAYFFSSNCFLYLLLFNCVLLFSFILCSTYGSLRAPFIICFCCCLYRLHNYNRKINEIFISVFNFQMAWYKKKKKKRKNRTEIKETKAKPRFCLNVVHISNQPVSSYLPSMTMEKIRSKYAAQNCSSTTWASVLIVLLLIIKSIK